MAYRMVQLPMSKSEAEGHFSCFMPVTQEM